MRRWNGTRRCGYGFSALQRAEIAEMLQAMIELITDIQVSVLFNEPKLLKSTRATYATSTTTPSFSALQRAEIAEMRRGRRRAGGAFLFQCSSTSRNC